MVLKAVNGTIVDVGDDEPPLDLTVDDSPFVPPDTDNSGADSLELECQTCGKPLTYGGRGRKPKYCDEHKNSKSNSTISPDRNASGVKSRGFQGEAQLRTALEARYMMMPAFAVMLGRPQYAGVMRESIADCVDADIEYARANLAFRKLLEGGVEKSALAAVIVAHAKMVVPIVIGERVRASQAVAKPSPVPVQAPEETNGTIFSRRTRRPQPGPFRGPANPQAQAPKPTDLFFPAEARSEPDSINAGNLPGMPG